MTCLEELRKQQVVNKKMYDQRLIDGMVRKLTWNGLRKNVVMGGDMMIDMGTGDLLGPDVDSTYLKNKF